MRNRRLTALILAAIGLTLVACGSKRININAAPPTSASGVTFSVTAVKAKKDVVHLYLKAENLSGDFAQVYTGLIGAVGPDGQAHYALKGKTVGIPPHASKVIKVTVMGGPQWRNLPGFFVRLDGVCVGNSQVGLQPISVNAPSGGAGQPSASGFSCGGVARSGGVHIETPVGSFTIGRGRSSPPPTSGGGMQRYTGVRQKIKQDGLKCAAMPLSAPGISEELAFIMDDVLLTELQKVGFEAIGPDDINALVGFERIKDAVGCDDAACIAEIGNALGVEYLVSGKVASLEGSLVLTLKVINVRETRVVARASRIADGGQKTLPRLLGEAVQDLVRSAKL